MDQSLSKYRHLKLSSVLLDRPSLRNDEPLARVSCVSHDPRVCLSCQGTTCRSTSTTPFNEILWNVLHTDSSLALSVKSRRPTILQRSSDGRSSICMLAQVELTSALSACYGHTIHANPFISVSTYVPNLLCAACTDRETCLCDPDFVSDTAADIPSWNFPPVMPACGNVSAGNFLQSEDDCMMLTLHGFFGICQENRQYSRDWQYWQ